MAVLRDRRHERVAELLAAMATPEAASAQAGYDTAAKSFGPNARKRACRPDIKARVAELQARIAAVTVIDAAWVRDRVAKIGGIDVDREDIRPSDIIAALALLAKMTPGALVPTKIASTDPSGEHQHQLDFSQLSNEQILALRDILAIATDDRQRTQDWRS